MGGIPEHRVPVPTALHSRGMPRGEAGEPGGRTVLSRGADGSIPGEVGITAEGEGRRREIAPRVGRGCRVYPPGGCGRGS